MERDEKQPTIIFLHIPKTAGTTLISLLEQQYPSGRRFHLGPNPQDTIPEFRALSDEQKLSIDLLYGHMPLGLHEECPRGAEYFTVLRDPIECMLSFYFFVRRNKEHFLYDMTQGDPDLVSFMKNGQTSVTDNFQVRVVSGVGDQVPIGGVTKDHLRLAKDNLRDTLTTFGLTERFDESLLLFQDAFRWPSVTYHSRNVTKARPQQDAIPPEALTAIADQNRFDMELYAFAQNLFSERVAERGPEFEARLGKIQRENARAAIWVRGRFLFRKLAERTSQLIRRT